MKSNIYIAGVIAFLVGLVLDNLVVSLILARSREFDTIILGGIIISFVLASVAESVSQNPWLIRYKRAERSSR